MQRQISWWIVAVTGGWLMAAGAVHAQPPETTPGTPPKQSTASPPATATPIMTLDEVKVGMTGYGKTVFHGDRIEPFAVEVVSVISDSSAKRGTVWVVCPDERMQRSGPVQGMSGSPIYLWDEGEVGTIGEGGRLIGAFAFGYSDVNVCLVGVQPIEYMREVGDRANAEDLDQTRVTRVPPGTLGRSLSALQTSAEALGTPRVNRFGLDAVQRLVDRALPGKARDFSRRENAVPMLSGSELPGALPGAGDAARVMPMRLPLSVGSAEVARLLGPLLEPAGIAVMGGQFTAVAGKPPSNVDPSRVRLEPGSVLSIPLAFGDLDLNAAGTVTDVLPDGTVLAFGHAMNAVGSSRMPMATGYTHFVVSRDSISFKQASSLDIVGSIVRDEASAVAGVGGDAFIASPVSIHVEMPGQPARDYNYQVIDDFQLTPAILAAVANGSLNAVQAPPVLHTVTATGELRFTGGRTFRLNSVSANGGISGLIFDMLPPAIALMQNPFDPLKLESADLSIVVDDGSNLASMVSATLDKRVAQPGDTLNVTLHLQPFDQPAFSKTMPFTLPTDLAEGEYQLLVSDAGSYEYRMTAARPEFADLDDVDELMEALQMLGDIDRKAVYVGLPLLTPGVAVGGRAMDHLPSSRALVLGSTASSTTMPYPRFVEQSYPVDHVISGEMTLPLRIVVEAP